MIPPGPEDRLADDTRGEPVDVGVLVADFARGLELADARRPTAVNQRSKVSFAPGIGAAHRSRRGRLGHGGAQRCLARTLRAAIATARTSDATFMAFENALRTTTRLLGRLLIVLFLSVREERERAKTPERVTKHGRQFRRRPAQARNLNTIFGVVRYFRTYLRGPDGHGFHPLDVALGLTADRMSMTVLGLAARLATMLSFARVHATLGWFLGAAPSTEVIENTVLGLGRRTSEWFERAPAPEDDGEVLIIQFDSKGAPTATETELERRRGPRRPNEFPHSARHRGRDRRQRYGSKPRRKKGDKSKNARMATIVVMYTLRRAKDGTEWLLGPVNRRQSRSSNHGHP